MEPLSDIESNSKDVESPSPPGSLPLDSGSAGADLSPEPDAHALQQADASVSIPLYLSSDSDEEMEEVLPVLSPRYASEHPADVTTSLNSQYLSSGEDVDAQSDEPGLETLPPPTVDALPDVNFIGSSDTLPEKSSLPPLDGETSSGSSPEIKSGRGRDDSKADVSSGSDTEDEASDPWTRSSSPKARNAEGAATAVESTADGWDAAE